MGLQRMTAVPALMLLIGCGAADSNDPMGAGAGGGTGLAVDGARIAAADQEPGSWLTYGRTYDEQRFSPLDQITTDNVDQIGLA